jgi:DNA-binding CsgD family transcriptional regulator
VLQSAGIGVIASVADAADASTVLRRVGADAVVVSALTCQAGVSDTRTMAAHRSLGCPFSCSADVAIRTRCSGCSTPVRADTSCSTADGRRPDSRGPSSGGGELVPQSGPADAAQPSCPRRRADAPYERLTQRERQVLALLAGGRSNREIAAALELSVHTVAVHRASLKRTLAVRKTAALVLVAVRHGLVTAE